MCLPWSLWQQDLKAVWSAFFPCQPLTHFDKQNKEGRMQSIILYEVLLTPRTIISHPTPEEVTESEYESSLSLPPLSPSFLSVFITPSLPPPSLSFPHNDKLRLCKEENNWVDGWIHKRLWTCQIISAKRKRNVPSKTVKLTSLHLITYDNWL